MASKKTPQPPAAKIAVEPLDKRCIRVPIVGTGSIIQNRFSDAAIEAIRHKQEGGPKKQREAKDPVAAFRGSAHLLPGSTWGGGKPKFGHPAVAFKKAMAEAAVDIGISKAVVLRNLTVKGDVGDLVEIRCASHRHDIRPGINTGAKPVPDIRHRVELCDWSAVLTIEYTGLFSAEQIVNLVNLAGFTVGVGSLRPRCAHGGTGTHGTWEVDTKKQEARKTRRKAS